MCGMLKILLQMNQNFDVNFVLLDVSPEHRKANQWKIRS